MICKLCNKNPATIHIQEIVNGEKKTLHICAECAAKKAQDDPVLQGFNLADMLYSLSGQEGEAPEQGGKGAPQQEQDEPSAQVHVCPKCGWDDARFRKSGRLGCAQCYEVFSEVLAPALSNMHRGKLHVGKAPGADNARRGEAGRLMLELASLQKELDGLVKREEYEKAADLRDRIASLKGRIESAMAQGGSDAGKA